MLAPTRNLVFVVDKDTYVRRLIQQFVVDAYDVVFFDDGYAALDRVRREAPDVLVTEVMTALLDGLSLCRLLKADPVTTHVPILAMSILAAAGRAKDSGADGFFQKPLEKARFLTSLSSLVGSTKRGDAHSSPEHAPK